ncbi:hypothetical protein [Paenibacillus typhae]|uniref:hypothetical protein n=1 Tax=Paenibacillus typhae TaxID=1174501 RepID=UPI001C8D9C73|nr:hypothetical protein [Paenibacillus typhae]MBY0014618.1 hypothetical protein [Paenibacillus typhae]
MREGAKMPLIQRELGAGKKLIGFLPLKFLIYRTLRQLSGKTPLKLGHIARLELIRKN